MMDPIRIKLHSVDQAHAAISRVFQTVKTMLAHGTVFDLTIKEFEDDISAKQRAFLHKAVFPQIEEQYRHPDGTRTDWRTWKEYYRARFLGDRWVMKRSLKWNAKTGQMVLAKRATPHRERVSTEDLGVKSYSQYIDTVIDNATVELGVQFQFRAAERDEVRYVAPQRKARARETEETTA